MTRDDMIEILEGIARDEDVLARGPSPSCAGSTPSAPSTTDAAIETAVAQATAIDEMHKLYDDAWLRIWKAYKEEQAKR
jgi:hypothetical protein